MKNHYLKFYHFIDNLNIKNIENLHKNIGLIYRNYNKKPSEHEICKFKNYCKKNNKKFLISNYHDLVNKHKLDGYYIPSFNKKKNYLINKNRKDFILIGSAHNIKEIRIKEKQGVSQIILSPIFKSTNSNKPLGLYRYNLLSTQTKLPTLALGGINKKNIKFLKIIKTKGFASISYFKDKN
jgi:thiamine-phosphate pyrophosphorylase